MPLDLPLSALRRHAKDRIPDVDAFLAQTLAAGAGAAPDKSPAPAADGAPGGAQPRERP
jgi:hypothetical protein